VGDVKNVIELYGDMDEDDDEAVIAVVQKGIEFIEKISNIEFFIYGC
jgi:hypothetical protein